MPSPCCHSCLPPLLLAVSPPPFLNLLPVQNVRQRRTGHTFRRGSKQQLAMWYVLLPSQQERRVVQGALIRSMQDAGFQLLSAHDAAMAHRK